MGCNCGSQSEDTVETGRKERAAFTLPPKLGTCSFCIISSIVLFITFAAASFFVSPETLLGIVNSALLVCSFLLVLAHLAARVYRGLPERVNSNGKHTESLH